MFDSIFCFYFSVVATGLDKISNVDFVVAVVVVVVGSRVGATEETKENLLS